MAHVRSVHRGRARDEAWAGRLRCTAIDKRPVAGRVDVRRSGVVGDEVADTQYHGGPDQAVYVFAREDLDVWGTRLGGELRDGMFGENLTTSGIDVNAALVGERWRVGEVLLEIAKVRIPCRVFKGWLGVEGYDDTAWVRRFTVEGRPGPYLRVLEEGALGAGDEIVVEHRPAHGITVSDMFRILTTERHRLPELLAVDSLAPSVRRLVDEKPATAKH